MPTDRSERFVSVRRSLLIAAAILVFAAIPFDFVKAADSQTIYRLGGNHFILRLSPQGDTTLVRIYRQAGDQWERFGATTMPRGGTPDGLAGRIVREGERVGSTSIDLDDWMNTDLNRNLGDRFQR